jgi:prepilin-type N-terminal cleavage/methylation domain-containing protein
MRRGFTLIELMIALAMICILAVIGYSAITRLVQESPPTPVSRALDIVPLQLQPDPTVDLTKRVVALETRLAILENKVAGSQE